ncbi:4Fe-4S dicluster domain-containing protein [Shigella flexneri]
MYGQFEQTFMMSLPRLCEHCLNPACVATCPSGEMYNSGGRRYRPYRIRTTAAAGVCAWTGCPYEKIYFNWKSGKSEKCIFSYPPIEAGQPTGARKPVSAVSATSVCCSMMRIALKSGKCG